MQDQLYLVLIHHVEAKKIQVAYQNETAYRFVVEGEITFNGPDPTPISGTILPGSLGEFGMIPYDLISDYPHFELKLERHSDKGHEETSECKIKTKPKHMAKKSLLPKWGNRPGRVYSMWAASKKESSLADVAVPKSPTHIPKEETIKPGIIRDLSELSVFNRELDLHAEKLFDDPKSVLPEVILQKQIKTFVGFMDKAKSMNIDRVFVIHGVGSGRLKTEITKRLEYDPSVASFTNEYHLKYGFGATEIVFKG